MYRVGVPDDTHIQYSCTKVVRPYSCAAVHKLYPVAVHNDNLLQLYTAVQLYVPQLCLTDMCHVSTLLVVGWSLCRVTVYVVGPKSTNHSVETAHNAFDWQVALLAATANT